MNLPRYRRNLTRLKNPTVKKTVSAYRTPGKHAAGLLPGDESKNPVFRLGRAVAGFMLLVWAGVLLLVFYLVFRFWFA